MIQVESKQDSYEGYKKYLEDSIGVSGIPAPRNPMKPYIRYLFQRSCQEKSKGRKVDAEKNKVISEEWKNLDEKNKQYYIKLYEIRLRQRQDIFQEYNILTKRKKPGNAYTCFFQQNFKALRREKPDTDAKQLNRMVINDWRSLGTFQKQKYILMASVQQEKMKFSPEQRKNREEQYLDKIEKYHQQLDDDKERVLKKYGLDKQKSNKKQKNVQRQQLAKRITETLRKQQIQAQKNKQALSSFKKVKKLEEQQEVISKGRVQEQEKPQIKVEATREKIQDSQKKSLNNMKRRKPPKIEVEQQQQLNKTDAVDKKPKKKASAKQAKIIRKRPKRTPKNTKVTQRSSVNRQSISIVQKVFHEQVKKVDLKQVIVERIRTRLASKFKP